MVATLPSLFLLAGETSVLAILAAPTLGSCSDRVELGRLWRGSEAPLSPLCRRSLSSRDRLPAPPLLTGDLCTAGESRLMPLLELGVGLVGRGASVLRELIGEDIGM